VDPDGTLLTYEWGFGDGSTASGETTSHSFTDTGEYTVELTATDEYGNTDSEKTPVSVDSSLPSTVQHRYQFEQDASDSVGSRHGHVQRAGFTSTNPIEGTYSLTTNKNNQERVSFDSAVDVDARQNGIAFEFWIEFNSVRSGDGVFSLDDQNAAWYCYFSSSGTLTFAYRSGGNNPSVHASVQTGVLYHIICQYDPGTGSTELYVDEALKDSNGSGGGVNQTRSNNNLGSQKSGSRWLDAARIDDFRVHDQTIQ
jgi:PKD repeat protein